MRIGGRPRQVAIEDIVRVGCEVGLRDLSLKTVASKLGVSSTALYRHVGGRWGLERLVGEALLADLNITEDEAHDASEYLLSFGLQLRAFVLRHPGMGAYLEILFPRGATGRGIITSHLEALGRRGYSPDVAMMLSTAVASYAIGYATAEERQRELGDGFEKERDRALSGLFEDAALGPTHRTLPQVDSGQCLRLILTAVIGGLIAVAPPGRPMAAIVAELEAKGAGV